MASTSLLWWMDGYVEDPFSAVSTHLSPSWPPTFINSRGVTVGWFDSKIVIFLLQKCLGQNQLVTESFHKMEQALLGGQDVPIPVPVSPTPCLSVPGLPTSQANLQRPPAAAPARRPELPCCMCIGRCGFFSFSFRNSRLTICHD